MLSKLFPLVLVLGALGACNTVEGVGQDISAGGQAIESAADQAM